MAECLCVDCRKPCAKRLFCRECSRLLTEDHVWMIRMTYRSPMHSVVRVRKDKLVGGAGWGDGLLGDIEMMIRWEEQGLPCFKRMRALGPICTVLHELEYKLVIAAVAEEITARRRRNRARLQARNPKTWMRHAS